MSRVATRPSHSQSVVFRRHTAQPPSAMPGKASCAHAALVLCLWVARACTLTILPPINKCCPEEQVLSRTLEVCVPRTDAISNRPEGNSAPPEPLPRGVPWWLDAAALADVESGAAAMATVTAVATQGWTPPCPWPATAIAFASSPGRHLHARIRSRDGALLITRHHTANATDATDTTTTATTVAVPASHFCADAVDAHGSNGNASTTRRVFLACACGGDEGGGDGGGESHVCVRKCCPEGRALMVHSARKYDELHCGRDPNVDHVPLWAPRIGPFGDPASASHSFVFFRALVCPDGLLGLVRQRSVPTGNNNETDSTALADVFELLPTGSAIISDVGNGVPFPLEGICVDKVITDDGQDREALMACAAPSAVPPPPATEVARLAVPFAVGGLFLCATLVAFALLPREARQSSFRLQAAQAAALLPGHVALVAPFGAIALPPNICYAQAFVVQFSFLAAFFWLNVMCIDIAWAFGGVRAPGGSAWERDKRKFLLYSLYAWGCPAIISAVTAFLEFAEGLPDSLLRPNFGDSNCWFFGKMATLAYFYAPIAVLLLANLVLFAFTAARILRAQRETAMLRRGDSNRHAPRGDTKRLVLYLKLFCLMGVTWIFEIISWAEGSDSLYWYVTDAINMLRGVFIFVLFCCKPKVLKLIRRRLEELGVCSECNTVNGGGDASRWQRCLSRFCCCSSETNGVRGTLALRRSAQNGSAITTITNLSSSAGSGLASPPSYKMKMNQIKDKKSSLEVPVTGLSRPVAAQADEQMHSAEENLTK